MGAERKRTTLSGNEDWKKRLINRVEWKGKKEIYEKEANDDELSLKPLQIKVFLL